jgi:hypothetical protein
MSGISGPKIITSGCVLSLDAADKLSYKGSGTTWTDLSGNNNTGTLTNGPTFNAGNMGSIVYDGVDDSVTLSLVSSNVNNVTTEVWFKAITLPGDRGLFLNGNGGSSGYGLQFGACGTAGTTLYVFFGGVSCNVVSYSTLVTNTWYQSVYTRTTTPSTSNILYINGTSVSTNTSANPNSAAGNTLVGHSAYNGYISVVRHYNRTLSATEVLQNYNKTQRYDVFIITLWVNFINSFKESNCEHIDYISKNEDEIIKVYNQYIDNFRNIIFELVKTISKINFDHNVVKFIKGSDKDLRKITKEPTQKTKITEKTKETTTKETKSSDSLTITSKTNTELLKPIDETLKNTFKTHIKNTLKTVKKTIKNTKNKKNFENSLKTL